MYNRFIVEAPFTLFLGAGASKPLGKLLMAEFIDYLEKAKGFKGRTPFDEVVRKDRDLEFLFEELDEWIGKEYFAPSEIFGRIGPADGMIGPAGLDPRLSAFREKLREIVGQARSLTSDLKREVFVAYRSLDEPTKVTALFSPVFNLIWSRVNPNDWPIVVFTTNYDPAVEEFFELSGDYHLEDGFRHTPESKAYIWGRKQFDNFSVVDGKKNLVLFKLHGSAAWTRTAKGIVKSPVAIWDAGDKEQTNILIYPAKKKIAIEDPFFTAYDYFQRCMEHCKACIVIGYSFRDYDALTKLMSASRVNPGLRLLILDPDAKDISNKLGKCGIRAEALKFWFGQRVTGLDYIESLDSALPSGITEPIPPR